jgi:hypothetical protein
MPDRPDPSAGPDLKFMYCVSSGSYSDYRVLCVCDSQKRAKAVAAAMRADDDGYRQDAQTETIAFVDYDPVKVDVYSLSVEVWDNGTTTTERDYTHSEWPFDAFVPLVRVAWRWVRAPVHKNKGGRLDVHGTDQEAVRRVFSDRRAQLLAEDAFRLKREVKGHA